MKEERCCQGVSEGGAAIVNNSTIFLIHLNFLPKTTIIAYRNLRYTRAKWEKDEKI